MLHVQNGSVQLKEKGHAWKVLQYNKNLILGIQAKDNFCMWVSCSEMLQFDRNLRYSRISAELEDGNVCKWHSVHAKEDFTNNSLIYSRTFHLIEKEMKNVKEIYVQGSGEF